MIANVDRESGARKIARRGNKITILLLNFMLKVIARSLPPTRSFTTTSRTSPALVSPSTERRARKPRDCPTNGELTFFGQESCRLLSLRLKLKRPRVSTISPYVPSSPSTTIQDRKRSAFSNGDESVATRGQGHARCQHRVQLWSKSRLDRSAREEFAD